MLFSILPYIHSGCRVQVYASLAAIRKVSYGGQVSLHHLTFSGTSYEQGLAHGEELKDSIEKNIEVYFNRFEKEAGIDKNELIDNARIYLSVLREQNPEYVNGINGISESSSLDLYEIAMLNHRYELLYDALGKRYIEDTVDGCTSFALLPEATENNHLIMGQNWDWIPDVDCVLTTSKDVDGLQRLAFTEAGIFSGKPGMNSEGVGLAVNGMYSTSDDWSRLKKPFHLRCYEVLKSRNMDGALNALTGTYRSCTANFILGHSPQRAVSVELAPNYFRLIDPLGGIISHANHFNDPSALGVFEPLNTRRYLSEFRQKHMEKLLIEQKPVDIGGLQNILRDHEHQPQSLCRHRDETLPGSQHTITKTSMIIDLDEKKMWVTDGQPCKSEFEEFYFD